MFILPLLLLLLLPLEGRGRQGLSTPSQISTKWEEPLSREERGLRDMFATVMGVRTDSSLIR